MEKIYPLMFVAVAVAITGAVVLIGQDNMSDRAALGASDVSAIEAYALPETVAPADVVEAAPADVVQAAPAPEVVEMKTISEPVCAIEQGRKRCKFVTKEVPVQ